MLAFLDVERFSRETPESPAVLAPGRPLLNYRDLSHRVASVTAALDSAGLLRDEALALVSPNGPEFLLSLFGASALGACAPLDPGAPESEYRSLLPRLRAPALVVVNDCSPAAARAAQEAGMTVVHLGFSQDYSLAPIRAEPGAGTEWRARQIDAELMLFTSSTTGQPKLVPITNANLQAACSDEARVSELGGADRLLILTPLFNLHGVREVMTQLHLGGSVVCPPAFDPTRFPEWLEQFRPTWITIPAGGLNVLRSQSERLPRMWRDTPVRFILTGGAAASSHIAGELEALSGVPILETYGTTEACCIARHTRSARKRGSAGKTTGIEIAILNDSGTQLPAGSSGEVAVRGPSVMSGYLDDEEANRRAFTDGWLRTGDLGHLDADGFLFLTGRKDDVINRGGQKILPEKVEAVLRDHPAVEEVVVFGMPHQTLGSEVAAGVVLSSAPVSEIELRRFAAARLPAWQVPRRVLFLEALPRNAAGKPSRKLLAETHGKRDNAEAPRDERAATETEKVLAEIWREWLGPEVGRDSEFYRLGGDSLTAVLIAIGIRTAFGIDMDLRAFAEYPSLRQLAAHVDALRVGVTLKAFERVSRDRPFPLSFAQERTWTYTFSNPAPEGYCPASHNIGHAHIFEGPLDPEVLRDAVRFLISRHEILRTAFTISGGMPVQEVRPNATCEIPLLDFSHSPNPEQSALAALRKELANPLPLAAPPMMRLLLARLGPKTHWLLRVNVHLISDGQSWQIFFRELGRVYQDLLLGRVPNLPHLTAVGYPEFAVWQRRELTPGKSLAGDVLDWWVHRISKISSETPAPFHEVVNAGLPSDRKRILDPNEGMLWWGLHPETSARLNRLQFEEGATYYHVRVAAFAAFVAHLRGVSRIVLGTPGTFRNRVEWQHVMGDFANFMTLILAVDPSATFRDTVRAMVLQVTDTVSQANVPSEFLGSVLRERGVDLPDVDVSFYANDHTAPTRAGTLEIRYGHRVVPSMPWAFSLYMDTHNEERLCLAMFDAERYNPEAVRLCIARFERFLESASRTPDATLATMLDASGREV
jgi:acyl-CoA synthetase (AMP-forming)/AMP-acid ligase II/acyl carrier protein